MVGRVLTGNRITRYGDGLTTLIGAEELTGTERDALLQLCRQPLGPRDSGVGSRHRPADHSTGCVAGVRKAPPLAQSRDRQGLSGGAVAGWCSLSRKACCIDSTGMNLMPQVHSLGLDLKHAIDEISALPVLDQLQG
jgi:hypothetical protein